MSTNISQGSVGTVEFLFIAKSVGERILKWNRSVFGKVGGKNIVKSFFWTRVVIHYMQLYREIKLRDKIVGVSDIGVYNFFRKDLYRSDL